MCHEVTGNVAEETCFLPYQAGLSMMLCFFIGVLQLSPPPDPIPHRVLSSPFPNLCLQAGQEAARAVLVGQMAHARAGVSADSVLSLFLSRDMNWGLRPTQSKVGPPIL